MSDIINKIVSKLDNYTLVILVLGIIAVLLIVTDDQEGAKYIAAGLIGYLTGKVVAK